MMTHTTVQALVQARIAELHDQPAAMRWSAPLAGPAAPGNTLRLARLGSWPASPAGRAPPGARRGACDGAHPAPGIRCPGAPGSRPALHGRPGAVLRRVAR